MMKKLFFRIPQYAEGRRSGEAYYAPRGDELTDADMLLRLWDEVAKPIDEEVKLFASLGEGRYMRDENGKWSKVSSNFDTSG